MRAFVLSALVLVAALPAVAQAPGTPAALGRLIQGDGTVDLDQAPVGALDLSGFSVSMGADGRLHARRGAASTPGTFTDISSSPSGPGLGGVRAIAVGPDGTLYAGGGFDRSGPTLLNSVARWDGTQWQPLSTGIATTPGEALEVNDMEVGPDGALYIGGRFKTAGGVPAVNVARWDGASWSALGTGMTGHEGVVHSRAFGPDGSLYAAGQFTTAGGVPASLIARWDGTAWGPLGAGLAGQDRRVLALAVSPAGVVYAGGSMTTAGGTPVANIARWNGASWSAMGSGTNGDVHALAVGPDETLYAGGDFTAAGGVTANHVARWDGTAWSAMAGGINGRVAALQVGSDGSVFAGATSFQTTGDCVLRWNGATWATPSTGVRGSVSALRFGPDGALYAGGEPQVDETSSSGVAVLDGGAWSKLGGGGAFDGEVSTLAVTPDGTLYAGGSFGSAGGVPARCLARRDGSGWHSFTTPLDGNSCRPNVMVAGPDGALYVGGSFTSVGGVPANNVVRWNGTAWNALGGGLPAEVLALAFGPDGTLYAVVGRGIDFAPPHISRWDGATWTTLPSIPTRPPFGPLLYALAVTSDGTLYTAGRFITINGVAATNIARWDGSGWSPLGTGIDGDVLTLAIGSDGAVYAGGRFGVAGGVPVQNVARWDGAAWSPLGNGLPGFIYVETLSPGPDGGLYATSRTNQVGRLDRWDGTSWSQLGGPFDGIARPLAFGSGGRIFVGGGFTTAGGVYSPFITQYTSSPSSEQPLPGGPGTALSLSVVPNPTRSTATATVTHPAGPATVEVFDTLGRRVAVASDGEAPAGTRAIPLRVDGLAPGVYVVRLTTGREVTARQLVIVR